MLSNIYLKHHHLTQNVILGPDLHTVIDKWGKIDKHLKDKSIKLEKKAGFVILTCKINPINLIDNSLYVFTFKKIYTILFILFNFIHIYIPKYYTKVGQKSIFFLILLSSHYYAIVQQTLLSFLETTGSTFLTSECELLLSSDSSSSSLKNAQICDTFFKKTYWKYD